MASDSEARNQWRWAARLNCCSLCSYSYAAAVAASAAHDISPSTPLVAAAAVLLLPLPWPTPVRCCSRRCRRCLRLALDELRRGLGDGGCQTDRGSGGSLREARPRRRRGRGPRRQCPLLRQPPGRSHSSNCQRRSRRGGAAVYVSRAAACARADTANQLDVRVPVHLRAPRDVRVGALFESARRRGGPQRGRTHDRVSFSCARARTCVREMERARK